ncbi:hypothetical protein E4T43_03667 [Aureobasidium subglaciale]|nr:hypothetical protein E4T43_03667 [Aureobasidium subglaciale]
MFTGSCSCKKIKVELSGQPQTVFTKALCHCADCRKITGCPYSYNFIVQKSDLTVTGTPATLPKMSDSGKAYENYYCKDCGTPVYGTDVSSDKESGTAVIRAGVFDDLSVLQDFKPAIEIYTAKRLKWIAPVEGCMQFEGMPPSA